jgi:hypothetical protein
MLLVNTTDDLLSHRAGIRPPAQSLGEERSAPSRLYVFAPGQVQEVADDAGEILLEHLEPRGLARFRHDDDMDAVRRNGRLRWFAWLRQQVKRHVSLNERQRAAGLGLIEPNNDVLKALRTFRRLKETEFNHEAEFEAAGVTAAATPDELEELLGDAGLTRNAERRARHDAEVGEQPPA